jgi:hypothetical protein
MTPPPTGTTCKGPALVAPTRAHSEWGLKPSRVREAATLAGALVALHDFRFQRLGSGAPTTRHSTGLTAPAAGMKMPVTSQAGCGT